MTSINLLPLARRVPRAAQKSFSRQVIGRRADRRCAGIYMDLLLLRRSWVIKARETVILQSNIAEMDKKVAEISELKSKKQEMISRMKVIQDLQGNRSEVVKVFDELVRAVPDGALSRNP